MSFIYLYWKYKSKKEDIRYNENGYWMFSFVTWTAEVTVKYCLYYKYRYYMCSVMFSSIQSWKTWYLSIQDTGKPNFLRQEMLLLAFFQHKNDNVLLTEKYLGNTSRSLFYDLGTVLHFFQLCTNIYQAYSWSKK